MLRNELSGICECSAFMYAPCFRSCTALTRGNHIQGATQDCMYLNPCKKDNLLMVTTSVSGYVLETCHRVIT